MHDGPIVDCFLRSPWIGNTGNVTWVIVLTTFAPAWPDVSLIDWVIDWAWR